MSRPATVVPLALAIAVLATACGASAPATTAPVADAQRGVDLFQNNCAQCHGIGAVGTATGPSFLDRIYEPSHHGDEAFQRAAALGVQPHHWTFGPMPPIGANNGLTRDDIADIVAHVRGLQRDAGIG